MGFTIKLSFYLPTVKYMAILCLSIAINCIWWHHWFLLLIFHCMLNSTWRTNKIISIFFTSSRWRFEIFFLNPVWGRFPIRRAFFSSGWFNHQPVFMSYLAANIQLRLPTSNFGCKHPTDSAGSMWPTFCWISHRCFFVGFPNKNPLVLSYIAGWGWCFSRNLRRGKERCRLMQGIAAWLRSKVVCSCLFHLGANVEKTHMVS